MKKKTQSIANITTLSVFETNPQNLYSGPAVIPTETCAEQITFRSEFRAEPLTIRFFASLKIELLRDISNEPRI